MALSSGAMVGGRYRLQRLIATGGMGQVWEGLDTRLDRRVAVKILKAELSGDEDFLTRFRQEARTTAQLNHPGIAGVFDYGETTDAEGQSIAYLVMELVHGEPLNAVLSRVGRLSLPHTLDMLEQTGRALQAAHAQGVVHRDVKPGNILITPTGQVKITDFGIAKAVDASPVTRTGMVMGTAQYIAPEQALGQEATSSSDVYSLGVVGYEALSGKRPFTGESVVTVAMKQVQETPQPLPDDIPSEVRRLIEITMTKDPANRYADGGEFADAVAAVRAGDPAPLPGGTPGGTGPAGRVLPPGFGETTNLSATRPASRGHVPTGGYVPPAPPAATTSGRGGSTPKGLLWAIGIIAVLAVAVLGLVAARAMSNDSSESPATTTTAPQTTRPTTTTTRPTTTAPTYTETYVPPPVTTFTPSPTTAPTTTPEPTTTEPSPEPTPPPTTTAPTTQTTIPTTTASTPTSGNAGSGPTSSGNGNGGNGGEPEGGPSPAASSHTATP